VVACIAKGTVVHADEAASWDNLHERFEVKRINQQEAYSHSIGFAPGVFAVSRSHIGWSVVDGFGI
jgi:hypothetical protein